MRNIALLALCIAAVAAVPTNPQRIVGGSTTTIDRYPSIGALLHSWNYIVYMQSCGGTILNTRSVLTAAHCPVGDRARQWRVRVGSTFAHSGGVVHNFDRIIIHPSFNRQSLDFDIAVMRTSSTISHNNSVRPASIAGANYNLADRQPVWAAGWGATRAGGMPSERLRHVQIYTINQATCRQRYSHRRITDNMLCSGILDVGGRDQCQGDSGGPLYHNGVVVGVCSFGRGCASPQFPGVNARVSTASTWIRNNS